MPEWRIDATAPAGVSGTNVSLQLRQLTRQPEYCSLHLRGLDPVQVELRVRTEAVVASIVVLFRGWGYSDVRTAAV